MSPYTKLVLDEIFGTSNFQNEIIYRNTDPKNNTTKNTAGYIKQYFLFKKR